MILRYFLAICLTLASTTIFANDDLRQMEHRYEAARSNPNALKAFLFAMPKGGDLHTHESGASLSENMLNYATNDHLCINPTTDTVYSNTSCSSQDLLTHYLRNPAAYNAVIDAWSMRDFNYSQGLGHDHFFATFGKFGVISDMHRGQFLAEIMQRAALQNESYLELMVTADGNESGQLGNKLGYNPDFAAMRERLLSSGLNKAVQDITTNLNQDEQTMHTILACQTKNPQLGCHVTVRYLYQVLREQAPEAVFAQLVAGFEAATKDPRVVGINMVQPEDGTISMRDYALHMQMVGYLRTVYPSVHVSLHAGELAPGLVAPEGLTFHIHDAVEVANADRIGHGVDIMQENQASQLLTTMAKKHVLVEINLTSNADILDIKGKTHPLGMYLQYGVPVALSTDDEGINREDMTDQYLRAMSTYPFTYGELKNVVRNSLNYSFASGQRLWMDGNYRTVNQACAKEVLGTLHPSKACKAFLNINQKAALQWDLERRFHVFEKNYN